MKPNLRASVWMIAVAGIGLATQLQAASINLNTGVDSSGTVLPDNSAEVRYTVSYLASGSGTTTPAEIGPFTGIPTAAIVADQNPSYGLVGGPWVADPSNARWISPYQGGSTDPWTSDPAGYYDYKMTFYSPSAGSLSIAAGFASDNTGWAYDNGVLQSTTGFGDFGALNSFNFSIAAGNNVIDFVVWNPVWSGGNPSGLLVQSESFTVPDGGLSVALLGFALVGVEGLRRKLRK
jgi:hypothetical protein